MINLKRLSATCFVSLALCASAFAADESKWEVGFLAGLNMSMGTIDSYTSTTAGGTVTTGSNQKTSAAMQTAFGMSTYYGFNADMGLELDLLHQARGFRVLAQDTVYTTGAATATTTTTSASTVRLNYVNIPLMFRWSPAPEYLRIGVGGYMALALEDSYVSDLTATNGGVGKFASTDFGLIGSIRGTIPVGDKINLVADVRYTYGLTDTRQPFTAASGTVTDSTSKLSDITILVGPSFKF